MGYHKAPPGHTVARSGLAAALVAAVAALVTLALTSGLASRAVDSGQDLAAAVRSWWPIEGSDG